MEHYDNDDWFFDSIRSYKTLQMYDLQMKPERMVKSDDDCLCLAGIHPDTHRAEILCIEMPNKLKLPEEEGDRCKGNDFEIRSGGFFDEYISSIDILQVGEKAISSFKDIGGLTILDLGINHSTVCKGEHLLQESNMIAPNFTVNSANDVIVTKTTSHPIVKVDCISGCQRDIALPGFITATTGEVTCQNCRPSVVALLNKTSGSLVTFDFRSEDTSEMKGKGEDKDVNYVLATDNGNKIGTLGSNGNVSIFDNRQPGTILAFGKISIPNCSDSNHKIQLASSDRISISGFDSTVLIYEIIESGISHLFTHHGHTQLDERLRGVVSDHLWLPHISKNLLISCAENGTLNSWEYVQT